jgi:hypothetical protein
MSKSLEAAFGAAVRNLSFSNSRFDRSGVRLTRFPLAETDSLEAANFLIYRNHRIVGLYDAFLGGLRKVPRSLKNYT